MVYSGPAGGATSSYAIVGNGIAGITAAEILRTEDARAEITVIADDPYPAYYRPALKDYLAGRVREEKLWARPTNFYQEHAIHFLHERVVGIQAAQHVLELQSGKRLGYQKLLLAQGALASRLTCPGSTLQGVLTLRSVTDYQWVENYLSQVERIVVVGSGTLALETIETLRHRGYHVTHLLRKHLLWSEVLDATASDLVLQQERRAGVEVRQGEEVTEIVGRAGRVSGVVTTGGAQLSCELVLVAIGIDPMIDFAQRCGIRCGRGISVDTSMRTTVPDIYAAGDVLETIDPLTGRARVVGQWYPAIQQARAAAYAMLGLLDSARPFLTSTFYNASFLYGLDFASAGMTVLPGDSRGYQEIVADPQPKSYQKVVLKGSVPVGMLALGQRKSVLAYKRAIDHRVDLLPVLDRLFAPGFDLAAWLDMQGVPAPILGVSREGALAREAEKSPLPQASAQSVPGASRAGLLMREAEKSPLPQQAVQPPVQYAQILSAEGRVLLKIEPAARTIVIGREANVVLHLDHPSVSRQHARISLTGDGYLLEDLGSTNGTLLNGVRLARAKAHPLQNNDLLQFGNLKCTFQITTGTLGGAVLADAMDVCSKCGARSAQRAASYCRFCGTPFHPGVSGGNV